MNIKYENYVINQVNECSDRFDVIKVIKGKRIGTGNIKNPNGEEFDKEDDLAYGVDLEYAIKLIALDRLNEKKETVNLNEFLEDYKNEVNKLLKAIEV